MVTPKSKPVVTVPIDRLASGGEGVGRVEGKAVFVPFTAPGDVASVEIVTDRRSFSRGRLIGLLTPSPRRITPPCPLFGRCGGCQWQHIPYEDQLSAKASILVDALGRIGGIDAPADLEVVPSPRDYGYRHRCRIQVQRRDRETVTGFFQAGSHDVVSIDRCPVVSEPLDRFLSPLRQWLASHPSFSRDLTAVSLSCDYRGTALQALFFGGQKRRTPPQAAAGKLIGQAAEMKLSLFIPGIADGDLVLGEGPTDLLCRGEAFTQINLSQNPTLVRFVISLLRPGQGVRILDLYGGIGNFSIPAAAAGAEVLGVDTGGDAVNCARVNADRLGLSTLQFRRGRAESTVVALAGEKAVFDAVLLNPPRSGAREAVEELPALAPPRIVMVSCDPATFARDAALLAKGGYRLDTLRAFDLFPQTHHLETVALFVKH